MNFARINVNSAIRIGNSLKYRLLCNNSIKNLNAKPHVRSICCVKTKVNPHFVDPVDQHGSYSHHLKNRVNRNILKCHFGNNQRQYHNYFHIDEPPFRRKIKILLLPLILIIPYGAINIFKRYAQGTLPIVHGEDIHVEHEEVKLNKPSMIYQENKEKITMKEAIQRSKELLQKIKVYMYLNKLQKNIH